MLVGVWHPTFVPVGASEMVRRGAGPGAAGAGLSRSSPWELGRTRGSGWAVERVSCSCPEGVWLAGPEGDLATSSIS